MLLGVLMAVPLAGCGGGGGSTAGSAGGAPSGEITVSAAASLTEALTEIAADFEAANPDTTVLLNFDSSGSLAEQIRRGAPVDVFASANAETMADLVAEERVRGRAETFAGNELAIVTEPGNPTSIASLADLTDAGVVALCTEDAPCGSFAADVLDRAGVVIPEDSITRGQNVKATLTAVTEGDATAAIVYATDAAAAGDRVETVTIPAEQNARASYPVAVLSDAPNGKMAEAFVTYMRSADGQAVLADFGFLAPS